MHVDKILNKGIISMFELLIWEIIFNSVPIVRCWQISTIKIAYFKIVSILLTNSPHLKCKCV